MDVVEGFPGGIAEAPASGATLDMRQVVRVERRRAIRDPPVPECSAPELNQRVHEGNIAASQAVKSPRLNVRNSACQCTRTAAVPDWCEAWGTANALVPETGAVHRWVRLTTLGHVIHAVAVAVSSEPDNRRDKNDD